MSQTAEPSSAEERVLAKCPRGDGREELRVALRAFKGHHFVDVRVWFQGDDGAMRPDKGCTIKRRELSQVASALDEVVSILEGTPRAPDPTEHW